MTKLAYKLPLFFGSVVVLAIVMCITLNTKVTFADFTYGAGRIIDDSVFTNAQSMSVTDIQNFLNSKVPTCDTNGTAPASDFGRSDLTHAQYAASVGWPAPPYTCLRDYVENGISSAQLIYNLAQQYQINPQVLIVTLQKESSLVTDSWPLPSQYKAATGYGCPDSGPNNSANCNAAYYGLTNQLSHTAHMYHAVVTQDPNWYSPYVVGSNYVQWNPNAACNGTNISIQNWSTAALYDYTPYQPNTAAWNAGWGTGDSCSAYGNRNFYLYFTSWFGSPVVIADFQVMKSSTTPTQYVVYNHMKQAIPSSDVKLAWGLDKMPLETIDQATIDSFTSGPDLDVVFRINGGSQLYLADSGLRHYIPSVDLMDAWQLKGKVISNVTTNLGGLPSKSNDLGYIAQASGQAAIYMIDGLDTNTNTILRNYPNPDVLTAYEGDTPNTTIVSTWRFSSISSNIGSALSSTKVSFGNNEYQVVAGQKLLQPYSMAVLYPGTATTISQMTFNRLSTSSTVTPFVRAANTSAVYLIQNAKKYYVTTPDILNAWVGSGTYVNIVNSGFLNLIPDSGQVVSSTLTNASAPYLMQSGAKNQIVPSMASTYTAPGSFTSSDQLMTALPTAPGTIGTRFVRDESSGVIAMLDNNATLHPIPDIPIAQLWGVDKTPVINLPHATFTSFTGGTNLSGVVASSTTSYAVLDGQLHTIANPAQWNLPTPETLPDSTISSLTLGSPLGLISHDNVYYYRVMNGTAYATTDSHIANLWGISNSSPDYGLFIKRYLSPLGMLTPVIKASNTYYIVDQNQIVSMSAALYANLAWSYPTMSVDPTSTGMVAKSWQQPLLQNNGGSWFVMDGGTLRPFTNPVIQNFWTENYSQPSLTVSDQLLSLFPTGPLIERAIKSNTSPNIYSAEAGTRHWITNPNTYQTMYAPYAIVTDLLLNAMPNGQNIY